MSVLGSAICAWPALGDEVPGTEPSAVTLLPGAASAQSTALADLVASDLPDYETGFYRYLWFPAGPDVLSWVKLTSFALNWLSSASDAYLPPVIGGAKIRDGMYGPAVVRVDLRELTATDDDTQRWIDAWEELRFDPDFNQLLTLDTIKLLVGEGQLPDGVLEVDKKTGQLLVKVKPYTARDGKKYNAKWVNVLARPAPYLDPEADGHLKEALETEAPVVHWLYFFNRAMKSIRDDGLFKDLFGGLYYDFAGVRTAKQAGKPKATDLDVLFEDLGIIDDAEGKVRFQDKLDRLNAEGRVAMTHSEVTGKVRVTAIIPIFRSNLQQRGVLVITGDVSDKNIDILKNVIANLLAFLADAREVLFVDSNGSTKYAIYDGNGKLLDEVPDTITTDRTIPAPYTPRLDTLSCLCCHSTAKGDGWRDLPNHMPRILPQLIGDVSNKNKGVSETNRLIRNKYNGDAAGLVMDLRRSTIAATLRFTGPWGGKNQLEVHTLVGEKARQAREMFWYTQFGAKEVLAEVFVDPGTNDPLKVLKDLLPPDPESDDPLRRYAPSDYRVVQLLAGLSISRPHFDQIKAFVAALAYKTIAQRSRK